MNRRLYNRYLAIIFMAVLVVVILRNIPSHLDILRGGFKKPISEATRLNLSKHVVSLRDHYSGSGKLELKDQPRDQFLCDAKDKSFFKFLLQSDHLFDTREQNEAFSKESPFKNKLFDSCAIISNSADLKDSRLGEFIDEHELVLRFNHAPTKGHEADVGEKTSIRFVNNQPLRSDKKKNLSEEFYSDSPIVVWDTGDQSLPTKNWRTKNFFTGYFARKQGFPSQKLYVQHVESVWSIWDWLKRATKSIPSGTPPSTGFLGFFFALSHCRSVRLFGFLPKLNHSLHCHYWSNELSDTCHNWHPFNHEKLLLMRLNEDTDQETYIHGFMTVQGFSELSC